MALSKTAIVQGLQGIVGGANVITDEKELQQSSIDRLRLYEDVHGVFTRPIPAAVVMARSTQHVAEVLKYANKSRINVVARTGRTATEGGLETAVANSIVLDGSGMNGILKIDTYNMQATAQCGVCLETREDEVRKRFGGMVNAFQYGAPPHGGCAAGIDRIVMLLADEANIREVILFPMNQRAEDVMMGAPSEPQNEQLRELRLRVVPPYA